LAVHIRLKRQGRKKRPFYRVIAIDSRSHREGREIERLGWYDPIKEELSVEFKEDRIFHWLGQGAIPTDTVNSLMRKKGLAHKWHLMKTGVAENQIETEMEAWAARQLEKIEKAATKKAEKKAAASVPVVEEVVEAAPETEAPAEEAPEAPVAEEVEASSEEAVVEEVVEAAPETEAPAEEAPEAPVAEEVEASSEEAVVEEVVEAAPEKVEDEKTEE
jgi:small subunit ribosomal protein S16